MDDTRLAILTDPLFVFSLTFVLGLGVIAAVYLITGSRRWHDRHHQNRSELMCDRCTQRRSELGSDAPPLRVLGDPRR